MGELEDEARAAAVRMHDVTPADFLELPARTAKPRATGLTHVLDKGASVGELSARLPAIAGYADLWKLGWGTAYVDPSVAEKIGLLTAHGVIACSGGTLLEIAWAQGRADELMAWAADVGFPAIEVSNGVVGMPITEKRRLIEKAAARFEVLAEVGSKDPAAPVSAEQWMTEVLGDIAAGARWAIAEGRESGTVGLYDRDGSVRASIVQALAEAAPERPVIFEAPRKDQQAWFIRSLGTNVSLGNVPIEDILSLEAMRLGLRADTAGLAERDRAPTAPS